MPVDVAGELFLVVIAHGDLWLRVRAVLDMGQVDGEHVALEDVLLHNDVEERRVAFLRHLRVSEADDGFDATMMEHALRTVDVAEFDILYGEGTVANTNLEVIDCLNSLHHGAAKLDLDLLV